MYESVKNIMRTAEEANTSAIAFICMDYVMARSVVFAAQKVNTPAIVMLFPEHVTVQHTTGAAGFATAVKELADSVTVPIGLHADHDFTYEAIMKNIQAGFQSVMMDGSMNDLDTNIALTKPEWTRWLFPLATLTASTRKRRIWIFSGWRKSTRRQRRRWCCMAAAESRMISCWLHFQKESTNSTSVRIF